MSEWPSQHVIIIFADIRGFSEFSKENNPSDVAAYIKRVYLKLMERFPYSDFCKATGDGLLITVPYDEKIGDDSDLRMKAKSVVEACLQTVDSFGLICAGEQVINFPVPQKVGFGISRGSACCLVSGDVIVDYSGHRLNLAARLLNLARPDGIVLDGAFGLELLNEETRNKFEADVACLRGISPKVPHPIHVLKEHVIVTDLLRKPLDEERWLATEHTQSAALWREGVPKIRLLLTATPLYPDRIFVQLECPVSEGGMIVPGQTSGRTIEDFTYELVAGDPIVNLTREKVTEFIEKFKPPHDSSITLRAKYIPKES
jgi:class 3 adenylate cyclase